MNNNNNNNNLISFPGIRRSNTTLCYPASNHSNQSNHLSGLSVLNSDNYMKQLHIERIDPEAKALRWASSLSDENENLNMYGKNDYISKNIEEVSNLGCLKQQQGKKVTMTKNERRKNNQNNLEDKMLTLRLKDLERQQTNLQMAIKRERFKLLDQFMDSKALNMTIVQQKKPAEDSMVLDLSMFKQEPSDFAKKVLSLINFLKQLFYYYLNHKQLL
jgi:exopolyphosphatase/pppGpp-phosphohydrolase